MITLLIISYLRTLYVNREKREAQTSNTAINFSCRHIRHLLLLLITLMYYNSTNAQTTLQYTIWKGEKEVGTMQALLFAEGEKEVIELQSQTKLRMVTTFDISIYQKDSFTNGRLLLAQMISKVNGLTNFNKRYRNNNTMYGTSGKTNNEYVLPNNIGYTSTALYFREPVATNKVYSTNFNRMLSIEKLGTGRYAITLPTGQKNTYYYQNGKCIAADLYSSITSVHIKLIEK